MRPAAIASVFAIIFALASAPVSAAPATKAESKAQKELRFVDEAIELQEFALAKANLEKTLKQLKVAGSAISPVSAQAHVLLGLVQIVGFKNTKEATKEFTLAINIQKDIALPASASDRVKLVFGRAYEVLYPNINCAELRGIFHKPVPLGQEGTPAALEVNLGKYLLDGSMMIMYRNVGRGKFKEASMTKVDGCKYRGEIPGAGVNAPQVEYYLESRLPDGRPSARKGKKVNPFAINVSFGSAAEATPPPPVKTDQTKVAQAEKTERAPDQNEEIDDLLLTKPRSAKGSGCAGCSTEGSTSGGVFWALLVLVGLLSSRRRQMSIR